METFSVILVIYARNSPVPGKFPTQRPVMWSFDVFFDLHLNKWLSKQMWGWWFEMPSCPLWHHCNAYLAFMDEVWCVCCENFGERKKTGHYAVPPNSLGIYNFSLFGQAVTPKTTIEQSMWFRQTFNSLWPSDAIWRQILVNIGSGNGLLPDGTKPLPEPMLTDHQWSPVTFIWGQFRKKCLNHQSLKSVRKLHI